MTTQPLDVTAVRESYCITDRDLQGEPLTSWRCAMANALDELEEARAERDRNGAELKDAAEQIRLIYLNIIAFAGQLQAWGHDAAAGEIVKEIMGDKVIAPDYYALKAENEALQAQLRVFELERGED